MGGTGEDEELRGELARLRAELATQKRSASESQELLRSLFASMPHVIATTDAAGNLLFVKNAPPHPDLLGKPGWNHLIASDRDKARAAFDAMMSTGEQQALEAVGESGVRWRVHLGPRFEDGRVVGATCIAWDVTEQRELETRLAVADRMAALGTLAAGVAHEVNNPLTYVLANVEWAVRESAERGDQKTCERLEAALEGVARIRSVVSDLSTFSHVDCERKQLLDVHALLETALRMAQTETRCRAHVLTSFGPIPPVLGSEARLGQVFLNLIVNAAQSLPEGEANRNEIVVATSTGPNGCAVIDVSDTGVGIEPALLSRIFEPFVTTKPRGVGTGLGLYICRNVVSSLGGELSVKSTPGIGTTFRVTMPPADAMIAAARSMNGVGVGGSVGRAPMTEDCLHLLVADDEHHVADVLRRFLHFHRVDVVHSGREAIDRLRAHDYDLAFCDLIMPDLTGMDVFEYLHSNDPRRAERIVFMTGNAFTPRAQRFLESVPNHVLHKPFTRIDVDVALARHVGRASA